MKVFLKKLWAFLKTYWYIPVVLLLLGITILFFRKNNRDKLLKMINFSNQKYQKEIDLIEDNEKLKEEERKRIEEQYRRAILEIEKRIEVRKEELNKKQRERIKALAESHRGDYDAMAAALAAEYGFTVVE